MSLGVADAKKLINELAPTGKYLIVDFTKGLAEFHFGIEVSARENLQMARVRKEYSRHIQKLGKKGGSTQSVGARSASEQIKAIYNAPTVPQSAMDEAEEAKLIAEQAKNDKEASNLNAKELAEEQAKVDAQAEKDLEKAKEALAKEDVIKAKAEAKKQAKIDADGKKLAKQKVADKKRAEKKEKKSTKASKKAGAKRTKTAVTAQKKQK